MTDDSGLIEDLRSGIWEQEQGVVLGDSREEVLKHLAEMEANTAKRQNRTHLYLKLIDKIISIFK